MRYALTRNNRYLQGRGPASRTFTYPYKNSGRLGQDLPARAVTSFVLVPGAVPQTQRSVVLPGDGALPPAPQVPGDTAPSHRLRQSPQLRTELCTHDGASFVWKPKHPQRQTFLSLGPTVSASSPLLKNPRVQQMGAALRAPAPPTYQHRAPSFIF